MNRERAEAVLARLRAERDRAASQHRAEAVAAELRAFMYPKQRAFFTSPAKRKASRKTRRAGATAGGCRELLARAVVVPKFRATYIGETRIEARARAWQSDTQSGLVDLLQRYGRVLPSAGVEVYELGGVEFEVRQQELALNTSTGGRIDLFGAADEHALNKQRGNAKHVYWCDEAQSFRWLERFYKTVAAPALIDFDGEFWATGTPDRDCAGMFWELTRDDGQPTLPGWEIHEFAAVDNPFFGATPDERWQRTAEKARAENGWSPEDPDFLREWCGRWVKTDANFVYAANAVPQHQLVYAPQRLAEDGFPDVRAALADLPEYPRRDYFLSLGADLGTRDDFAFVLWAWSLKDPVLYEVCSWKRPGLDYDEMAAHLRAVCDQVTIGIVVADAGGGGKPAVMGWSKKWVARYGLPITEADKKPGYKVVSIKQFNNDIRHGLVKFRSDAPLLAELLVHRWSPKRSASGNMVEDPDTPNHCADAALYSHKESYHHRYRESPVQPARDTPEWIAREERELAEAVISNAEDDYSSW